MVTCVDITNRKQLLSLLHHLEPGTPPLWGKMNAQQMVEHLVDQVEYTNGKKTPYCNRSAHEAERAKQHMFLTNPDIPRNVILGKLPENFTYVNLETAIKQLMKELDTFDVYFKKPGATAIHGAYGPMDREEWIFWHDKHFTHHFKQFGLIAE
jgi:hypothetical protein